MPKIMDNDHSNPAKIAATDSTSFAEALAQAEHAPRTRSLRGYLLENGAAIRLHVDGGGSWATVQAELEKRLGYTVRKHTVETYMARLFPAHEAKLEARKAASKFGNDSRDMALSLGETGPAASQTPTLKPQPQDERPTRVALSPAGGANPFMPPRSKHGPGG